jgi:hypothetical protein
VPGGYVFRGLPDAAPPNGRLRWRAHSLRPSGMVSATRRCDLRPTVFFDGMFLVQRAKGIRDGNAIRMPFAGGKG